MQMTTTVQFGMRIVPPSRNTKSEYTEIGEVDIPLVFHGAASNFNPFLDVEDIALGLEAAAAAIRACKEKK